MGASDLAAASVGIAVPIVTGGILVASVFSPALWTSVPIVMVAVLVANVANILAFLALRRARAGSEPLRSALSVGSAFSGVCVSTVLVLAGWLSMLGG